MAVRVSRQGPREVRAEGLVRPVGGELEAVTPFAREVEVAAGAEVVERLQRLDELPVGAAVVTPGGELPSPFLIHVVVQSRDEPASEITVERALRNGLRRSAEWGLSSLALPPLGTGAGALELERAAEVMLETVRSFSAESAHEPDLHLLVSTDHEEDVFHRAAERDGEAGSGGTGPADPRP